MPVVYCVRHLIGFNTDLDASCPQCSLAHVEPAEERESLDAARKRAAELRAQRAGGA